MTPRRGGDVPQRRYWVFHLGVTEDVVETWWIRTTETSLGVSFETYLRPRGDVLMGRRHYVPMRHHHDIPIRRREDVPLRRLADVPLRRHWVFHLRLV